MKCWRACHTNRLLYNLNPKPVGYLQLEVRSPQQTKEITAKTLSQAKNPVFSVCMPTLQTQFHPGKQMLCFQWPKTMFGWTKSQNAQKKLHLEKYSCTFECRNPSLAPDHCWWRTPAEPSHLLFNSSSARQYFNPGSTPTHRWITVFTRAVVIPQVSSVCISSG